MLDKSIKISKYIAIFSVLALFLVIGVSYAVVAWTTGNYNIALDSACFDINYVKGNDISPSSSLGTVDESVYVNGNLITITPGMAFTTVSIELDEDCYDVYGMATIEANVTTLSDNYKSDGDLYTDLTYAVVEYDPSDYDELTMSELADETFEVVSKGYIANTGITELHEQFMEPGEVKNYLILFYTRYHDRVVSGSFGASIDAEVVQADESDRPVYTPITDFTYYIGSYNSVELPEGKVFLDRYNSINTEVRIPSSYTIDGVDYEPIVNSALCFQNRGITRIDFPNNILFYYYQPYDKIYEVNSAKTLFENCSRLVEVKNLGHSITSMEGAFHNCTSLVNSPAIPNSVTNLRDTFKGCDSLSYISSLPNSILDMYYSFSLCSSLETAPIIPNSVTRLLDTFYGCINLSGTVRIISPNIDGVSPSSHPFGKETNFHNQIIVEVPADSTTYRNMKSWRHANVTIVEY